LTYYLIHKKYGEDKMKIILVKHGKCESSIQKIIAGHSDTPLTEVGRKQAKSLAGDFLKNGIKFDAVYSWDTLRASETTNIICEILGINDVVYDKRLREYNVGIFTGRKISSLTKEEKDFLNNTLIDLNLKTPGGESDKKMTVCVKEAFFEIINNHPEASTILLIGHGGTLNHILVRILNLLPSKLEERFEPCIMNILERKSKDEVWNLTRFNNNEL